MPHLHGIEAAQNRANVNTTPPFDILPLNPKDAREDLTGLGQSGSEVPRGHARA